MYFRTHKFLFIIVNSKFSKSKLIVNLCRFPDVFYLKFPRSLTLSLSLALSPARNTLIDGLVSMWYQSYNQVNHIIATLEKLYKAKLLH